MASAVPRPLLFAVVLALLCSQATALPLIIRLILEPTILDARIRAASVLNEAGLGVGGALTKIGEAIHGILSGFGKAVYKVLNKISKLFSNPNESDDDSTELGKQLNELKKQQTDKYGFVLKMPKRQVGL